MATGFEDVHEADEVALDVDMRVGDRVPDTGLRGQVDHHVEAFVGAQAGQPLEIRQITFLEAKAGSTRQPGQPVVLQLHRVIRVEIVQADDFIAPFQQQGADVAANESGRAGDEILHPNCSFRFSRRSSLHSPPPAVFRRQPTATGGIIGDFPPQSKGSRHRIPRCRSATVCARRRTGGSCAVVAWTPRPCGPSPQMVASCRTDEASMLRNALAKS